MPASPGERELQELVEQDPVGEAGQLVVVREERDLLLGFLALRDVEHHSLQIERFTRGTVDDDRAVTEPQHAPVASDEPVLEGERLAVGPTLHVRGHGSVAVIGVEMRLPQVGVVDVLRRCDPQQRFDLWADVGSRHALVGEIHVDDRWDVLHEGSVPRLRVYQLPLGADGVRDVEHQPEPELRVPLIVVDADGLLSDPDLPSVTMDRPVLLAEWLARRSAPLAGIDDAIEVVGMHHIAPAFGRGEPLLAGQAEQLGDARADVDHRFPVVDAVDVEDRRQPVDDAAVASLELPVLLGEVRECVGPGRVDIRQETAFGGQGVDPLCSVVVNRHVATRFKVVL